VIGDRGTGGQRPPVPIEPKLRGVYDELLPRIDRALGTHGAARPWHADHRMEGEELASLLATRSPSPR
jgi:hypothetical protein